MSDDDKLTDFLVDKIRYRHRPCVTCGNIVTDIQFDGKTHDRGPFVTSCLFTEMLALTSEPGFQPVLCVQSHRCSEGKSHSTRVKQQNRRNAWIQAMEENCEDCQAAIGYPCTGKHYRLDKIDLGTWRGPSEGFLTWPHQGRGGWSGGYS